MSKRKVVPAVALALLCFVVAPFAQGAKVLALAGADGATLGSPCDIYLVDTATATSTFLVSTGFNCETPISGSSTVSPNGLAYDFGTNRIYFSVLTSSSGSNLYFIDMDDASPSATCATPPCPASGMIGFPIDNAAIYMDEYYTIQPSTDDLYKVSFDGNGLMMGSPTLVSGDLGGGDWGFGDIVITDGGFLGASASRTATGSDAGCASAADGFTEVIFIFDLNTSTFTELAECDDTPVMQLALGGDATPPPGPPSGGLPETLFGTDSANQMFLVDQGDGERMLIFGDITGIEASTDWSDYIPMCECTRNPQKTIGFWLNHCDENLLPQTLGLLDVETCEQAENLLDKRDLNGVNRAEDGAYELAAQLLAALLNRANNAGCEQGDELEAINAAQDLLTNISFTGIGPFLPPGFDDVLRDEALNLAGILDDFNNGNLCTVAP